MTVRRESGQAAESSENMLARVVTGKKRFDHITPVLQDLHLLPIAQRVDFKLATIVFGQAPVSTRVSGGTSNRLRAKQNYSIHKYT